MELLNALAGGIKGAAQGAGQAILMEMEEKKQQRYAEYKHRLEDASYTSRETWKADESEKRQQAQATRIDEVAKQIAGKRMNIDPEVDAQADAAAQAYNDALSRGDITQEEANLGYQGAAEYRDSNAQADQNVTAADRTQAAIQLGAISPKDAATLQHNETTATNKLLLEQLREDRRDTRSERAEDRRDARLDRRLEGKAELSAAQKIRNAEIEFARKKIDGLSPEEIKKRTSSYTATGRTNPDYDPQLASRVKRANQRKYGDDPWFDDQTTEPQSGRSDTDIESAFRADQKMRGYSLGQQTPNGWEVFDTNGKLVGHYTR